MFPYESKKGVTNAPNLATRGASLSLYNLSFPLSMPNMISVTPINVTRITIKSIKLIF
jgi:hypothetical protein